MTNFKVGDKVRISAVYADKDFTGIEGVVTKLTGSLRWPIEVRYLSPVSGKETTAPFNGSELDLVKEEYTFDPGGSKISFLDVRKGDTIAHKSEDTWDIGVAMRFDDDAWWTTKGNMVTCGDVEYDRRLLHRPEPTAEQVQVEALVKALAYNNVAVPWAKAEALVRAGVKVDIQDGEGA